MQFPIFVDTILSFLLFVLYLRYNLGVISENSL